MRSDDTRIWAGRYMIVGMSCRVLNTVRVALITPRRRYNQAGRESGRQ
jgi:hypothetical protein